MERFLKQIPGNKLWVSETGVFINKQKCINDALQLSD